MEYKQAVSIATVIRLTKLHQKTGKFKMSEEIDRGL
jgi:hypothetical protein